MDSLNPTASILGIGTSLPKFDVDHRTAAKFAEVTSCVDASQARMVNALYRRTGIERRGSVLLTEDQGQKASHEFYPPAVSPEDRGPSTRSRNDRYGREAPVLAASAASEALQRSGVAPDEITHLITISCTGFTAPGIDIALIDELGLPATTERVQIGFMGCHGAVNGLRAGRGLLASSERAKVLISSVELCSLHYQYGLDADQIVSNALFADGSASVVLGRGESAVESTGTLKGTGSCLVPQSRDAMTWRIGDNGYQMTLSAQVPSLIEAHLESFLSQWLAEHGESIDSIGGWAAHPGGSRILSAVESTLKLPPDALSVPREILTKHGNMSSATMLFILRKFEAIQQPKPWLMLGFGPGLEIEVALIR